VGPGRRRQGERLSPRFKELADAFETKRAELGEGTPIEADPSLVIVLDLAGSVEEFYKAVNKVEGLEFLAEMAGDEIDPDDDFYKLDSKQKRSKGSLERSLYLVMSNARAVDQMVSLFGRWKEDPSAKFEWGLGRCSGSPQQCPAFPAIALSDRFLLRGPQMAGTAGHCGGLPELGSS